MDLRHLSTSPSAEESPAATIRKAVIRKCFPSLMLVLRSPESFEMRHVFGKQYEIEQIGKHAVSSAV